MSNFFTEENIKRTVIIVIIIVVAALLARIVNFLLKRYFKKSAEVLKVDPTNYKFFRNAVDFIIYLVATVIIFEMIPALENIGTALFASAGVMAAILGFASQQAMSNIISGVFIVISKPFRVGDYIAVGEFAPGVVEDITLRHTVINNFENRRVIIPNSAINTASILNSSINDQKTCIFIEIGISYDSDIDKAIKIIQEEAENHKDFIDNRSPQDIADGKPKIIVRVLGFGDSSVNLRGYIWSTDPLLGFWMKCDLNKTIKERFDKEGVEIPYPYRTIVYKKDL